SAQRPLSPDISALSLHDALPILPALLAKLGRAVDRPRIPFLWRLTASRPTGPRVWPKLLGPSLRHPGRSLVISVLGLLAIAAPRSEEHTSELQSPYDLVCRLLLE